MLRKHLPIALLVMLAAWPGNPAAQAASFTASLPLVVVPYPVAPLALTLYRASHSAIPPNIYLVQSDGSAERPLTTFQQDIVEPDPYEQAVQPSWAPDGTRLVYVYRRIGSSGNQTDLRIIDAAGNPLAVLVSEPLPTPATEFPLADPVWSPDGNQVAYTRWQNMQPSIWAINVDGTGAHQVIADASQPAWSPDGSRIAFSSQRDGNTELFVMQADGSGLLRLTETPDQEYAPDWSPDGASLVFVRRLQRGDYQVCVLDLARRSVRVVYEDNTGEPQFPGLPVLDNPDWSPDGVRIAFSWSWALPGGYSYLAITDANGGNAARVPTSRLTAGDPDWKPH